MMKSVRALVTALIDYAGLFPPAELSMSEAAGAYGRYLGGSFGWILARFVVPASALGELEEAARAGQFAGGPWRLSALAGPDLEADVARILAFNSRQGREGQMWTAVIDAVETRLDTAVAVQRAAPIMPGGMALYVEVPAGDAGGEVIAALAHAGLRAKLRTGGTRRDMFPSSGEIVRFLGECSSLAVPFKLTAGLHHVLAGDHPITADPGSETVRMHGFLNVFLAAAFLDSGMDADTTAQLLDETSPAAFRFNDDGIAWRDYWVSTSTLDDTRREFALSFGSCSFMEPVEELEAGGILED